MDKQRDKPPLLEGVTLEQIVSSLVERLGWEGLARRIRIHCFARDPSLKSCLTFLRKTPWARQKVENLYLATLKWGKTDRHTNRP